MASDSGSITPPAAVLTSLPAELTSLPAELTSLPAELTGPPVAANRSNLTYHPDMDYHLTSAAATNTGAAHTSTAIANPVPTANPVAANRSNLTYHPGMDYHPTSAAATNTGAPHTSTANPIATANPVPTASAAQARARASAAHARALAHLNHLQAERYAYSYSLAADSSELRQRRAHLRLMTEPGANTRPQVIGRMAYAIRRLTISVAFSSRRWVELGEEIEEAWGDLVVPAEGWGEGEGAGGGSAGVGVGGGAGRRH